MEITYSTNAWGPVLAHWAAPNCVNAAYYRCAGKLEQALADIAEAEEYASFAGWMRYRARFTLSEEEAGKIRALSLGEVGCYHDYAVAADETT